MDASVGVLVGIGVDAIIGVDVGVTGEVAADGCAATGAGVWVVAGTAGIGVGSGAAAGLLVGRGVAVGVPPHTARRATYSRQCSPTNASGKRRLTDKWSGFCIRICLGTVKSKSS